MGNEHKTGTDLFVEYLKEMETWSPEQLLAKYKEQEGKPHHWITQVMIDNGYFERLDDGK